MFPDSPDDAKAWDGIGARFPSATGYSSSPTSVAAPPPATLWPHRVDSMQLVRS